ncbi:hypothetical protein K443DRAFT_114199 [Laccaria amethystina LaAM-08-1]|uniref:Uncharacterized protein n=1 Tax=Laccaria amethystina LaAM-08-1 TaxID=1095629 RepID=A0A0C9X319_9AGAR|nr:hypothetical protein K443DRAFT_114199 [Laccaria amethystina LaAM-08-1]
MGHTLIYLFLCVCLIVGILPAASSPTYQLGEGFTVFATWGKGDRKYKLDLEVYHREVKPIFLARFRQAFNAGTFNRLWGTNPDFEIDKNGIVFPNAVHGQDMCTRVCSFSILRDVVLDHQGRLELDGFEDGEVSVFEEWGKGIYKINIVLYHKKVKPKFLAAFKNEYGAKKFTDMCGKNPNFDIDTKGWVWPNAVKGKSCSKQDYILELGDTIVLECQKNPNCLQRSGDVSIFETWGTGKYKLDMDVYHRTVKPIFLTRFRGEYGTKKFNDMHVCGTNPDFETDKNGWVWPNSIKGKNCSKKDYILDLGDVIQAHQVQADDGEEINDSLVSHLGEFIKVYKLQESAIFSPHKQRDFYV